jgi:hypothetical protein
MGVYYPGTVSMVSVSRRLGHLVPLVGCGVPATQFLGLPSAAPMRLSV